MVSGTRGGATMGGYVEQILATVAEAQHCIIQL